MKIRSPITGSRNTELAGVLNTSVIIDNYKERLNIDVKRFFRHLKEIRIYACSDTGYFFYYPFSTGGDSKFYEDLGKFPWYYMDWKWEHETTDKLIAVGNNVLEIGCGRGSFVEKIQQNGAYCTGLEINKNAAKHGQDKGLNIINKPIELFAKNNKQQFDFVCAFQVLEHVTSAYSFLKAAINVLKPGGNLVISVPNNDSLIFKTNQNMILNMPPHHMGLWNIHSLIKMQQHFGLRIESIELEPLQEYHQGYVNNVLNRDLPKILYKQFGFLAKYLYHPVANIVDDAVQTISPYIDGHTVLAVYSKHT